MGEIPTGSGLMIQQHQDNMANDRIEIIAKEERKAALKAKNSKEAKKKLNNNKGASSLGTTSAGGKNKKNQTK